MFAYGTHKESVQGILEDDSTETAADILSWTVRVLDYVTKHFDFVELAYSEDVTADTDGIIVLPPLRTRVNSIKLQSSPHTPFLFGTWLTMDPGRTSRYTYEHTSPVLSNSGGLSVGVTEGSTDVTSSALFGSLTAGQAVSFVGIDALFKAATITDDDNIIISPYYPGDTDAATTMYSAPAGVHGATLYYCGNTVSEADVAIKYQMRHPEIYDDYSLILISMPQTILLMTLQWALRREKYDVDADRLKTDVAESLRIEIGTAGAREAVPLTGMNAGERRPLFALKKGRLPDRHR